MLFYCCCFALSRCWQTLGLWRWLYGGLSFHVGVSWWLKVPSCVFQTSSCSLHCSHSVNPPVQPYPGPEPSLPRTWCSTLACLKSHPLCGRYKLSSRNVTLTGLGLALRLHIGIRRLWVCGYIQSKESGGVFPSFSVMNRVLHDVQLIWADCHLLVRRRNYTQ